jgi:hypothetical protein
MRDQSYHKMLKFHHMWRGKPLSSLELKDLSINLEDIGYESVLLTFHSDSPDYLVKAASAIIPGNKIKFMIALRPYHMSPQYCAMVTEGFNQIEPGRLMFNWIAGDSHNRLDEKPQMDIYGNTETLDNIVKRTTFLRDFVKQYQEMPVITKRSEMIFSGYSEYTLETTRMFGGTSLCMIDDYRNNLDRFYEIKKRMVAVSPIILENKEDVDKYKEFLPTISSRFLAMSIAGTREEVKKELLELENEGITDVLVNTHRWEFFGQPNELSKKNDDLVNELVKEIHTEMGKFI